MNKTLAQRFFHILQKEKTLLNSNSANNLPSISLNQLEKQFYDFKKKKNFQQNTDGSNLSNNKQLNVCSPFYDRMKTHKQNCKCPYHRKKPFSVIPVKRSEKKNFVIKKSVQKIKDSKEENRLQRFSNKQPFLKKKREVLFKSLEQIEKPRFSRSQNSKTKSRVDTRNLSYESFLKDCEYHLLKKRGLSTGEPAHIIRKGIQEIFEFIKSHLDWSDQKMRQWVQGFQKDRDYGEFYMERFGEMKKNYELALRRKRGPGIQGDDNQGGNGFGRQSNFTNSKQSNNRRYRSMNSVSNEQQGNNTQTDLKKRGATNNSFFKKRNIDSRQSRGGNKQLQAGDRSILAQQYLNKIFSDLRDMNAISSEVTQALMGLGFKQFNQIFDRLQKNIANNVYTDQMLARLDKGVIGELLKISFQAVFKGGKDGGEKKDVILNRNSIDSQKQSDDAKDKDFKLHESTEFQKKIDIIKKTQNILNKHRSRKLSNLSQRTSGHANGNSKHLIGSKKNTEDAQGQNVRSATAFSHSKRSSYGDFSRNGSQKNLDSEKDVKIIINGQKPFGTIDETVQIDEQHLNEDQRRRLMALGLLGHNVRRSKMMKPGQMFSFLRPDFQDNDDEDDYHFQKKSVELKRGYFTKAEKYLFDMNMDQMIIKTDDSLITAKRKMRVIKMVLKESPHAPEADILKNYVKQIEQKISVKTQKEKNLELEKGFQVKYMKDQEIWNSISMQNLGFDLIFYKISSQIRVEDSEDLCILLNDWKLINLRRLENRISYKMDLILGEDELKKKKKTMISDVLAQEDMRNMKFEPKIDSFCSMSPQSPFRGRKGYGKKYSGAISTAKDSKMSGFYSQNTPMTGLKQDDHDEEQQRECYYNRVKGVFKYAKMHLPETFNRYVKNSSFKNWQQDNSYEEI